MKKIIMFVFLFISVNLYAWVPSDFALLTWALEDFLSEPITSKLPDDYSLLINDSRTNFTNIISGHVNTNELVVMRYPGDNNLPSAMIFLYLADSSFDNQFEDAHLDKIVFNHHRYNIKIGCIGNDMKIVNIIKDILLSLDFTLYKAYEL